MLSEKNNYSLNNTLTPHMGKMLKEANSLSKSSSKNILNCNHKPERLQTQRNSTVRQEILDENGEIFF